MNMCQFFGLGLLGDPFLAEFISTAGTTSGRTSGHLDFSCTPIYLRVMLAQPRMSKYQFLCAQVGDTEGRPLQVVIITEYQAHDLHD